MKAIGRAFRIGTGLALAMHALECYAQPQPALSISSLGAYDYELQWPASLSTWQLVSTLSLSEPVNWLPYAVGPLFRSSDNLFFYFWAPFDSPQRFFRLEPPRPCLFQATPAVISAGGSSLLSWCPVAGVSYQLLPGPGPVSGSNYLVTPAVTTTYSLVSELETNLATVLVTSSGCAWLQIPSWDCSLNFSYELTPSSADYSFTIRQEAHLTVHLTLANSTPSSAQFVGYVTGNAQINDEVVELANSPPNTSTLIGNGPPTHNALLSNVSQLTLFIDCSSGTYTFTVTPTIEATLTEPTQTTTDLFGVGNVSVSHRALPSSVRQVASTEFLSARSPFWFAGGDLYRPGGLADGMFTSGLVNDNTAGSASVNWSFAPSR